MEEASWTNRIKITDKLPSYEATKDLHCPLAQFKQSRRLPSQKPPLFSPPTRKKQRAAFVEKRPREEDEDVVNIPQVTYQAFLGSGEMEVIRSIVASEEVLKTIRSILRPDSSRTALNRQVISYLFLYRQRILESVEAVGRWRRGFVKPVPFVWCGVNFLQFSAVSLNFLHHVGPLKSYLGISFKNNPLVMLKSTIGQTRRGKKKREERIVKIEEFSKKFEEDYWKGVSTKKNLFRDLDLDRHLDAEYILDKEITAVGAVSEKKICWWCGLRGKLVLCALCRNRFCLECLSTNLTPAFSETIAASKKPYCFRCMDQEQRERMIEQAKERAATAALKEEAKEEEPTDRPGTATGAVSDPPDPPEQQQPPTRALTPMKVTVLRRLQNVLRSKEAELEKATAEALQLNKSYDRSKKRMQQLDGQQLTTRLGQRDTALDTAQRKKLIKSVEDFGVSATSANKRVSALTEDVQTLRTRFKEAQEQEGVHLKPPRPMTSLPSSSSGGRPMSRSQRTTTAIPRSRVRRGRNPRQRAKKEKRPPVSPLRHEVAPESNTDGGTVRKSALSLSKEVAGESRLKMKKSKQPITVGIVPVAAEAEGDLTADFSIVLPSEKEVSALSLLTGGTSMIMSPQSTDLSTFEGWSEVLDPPGEFDVENPESVMEVEAEVVVEKEEEVVEKKKEEEEEEVAVVKPRTAVVSRTIKPAGRSISRAPEKKVKTAKKSPAAKLGKRKVLKNKKKPVKRLGRPVVQIPVGTLQKKAGRKENEAKEEESSVVEESSQMESESVSESQMESESVSESQMESESVSESQMVSESVSESQMVSESVSSEESGEEEAETAQVAIAGDVSDDSEEEEIIAEVAIAGDVSDDSEEEETIAAWQTEVESNATVVKIQGASIKESKSESSHTPKLQRHPSETLLAEELAKDGPVSMMVQLKK